jgi:hypothetical protein
MIPNVPLHALRRIEQVQPGLLPGLRQLVRHRPLLACPAAALALALAAVAAGCSQPPPAGPVETTPTPAGAPAAPATPPAETTTYEPAYPPDVSPEGLTEKDAAQQAKPHRHGGGEAHTHDEKEQEGDHGHPH